MFKFPNEKPNVKPDNHGWFNAHMAKFIKPFITSDTKVIVELGAWLGSSTRWLCENSTATIVSVDHWKGSIEHQGRKDVQDKLPTLYDTFIVNCWEYRDRIVPIRSNSTTGLHICKDLNIIPDLIFIDASHEYEDVLKDIQTADELFPKATLMGDDWSWKNRRLNGRFTVREAVKDFAKQTKISIYEDGRCWRLDKKQERKIYGVN